jgi:hypothetical protein
MRQDTARQNLAQIASNIRAAQQLLVQASRATGDAAILIKINTEYQSLDSYLSQVINAQNTIDDQLFQMATNTLKQQASSLQQEQAHIKAIIGDVEMAAQILGFIAQAASFAAML